MSVLEKIVDNFPYSFIAKKKCKSGKTVIIVKNNETVNKFPTFYLKKIIILDYTLSSSKCNEINYFVLSVKLKDLIGFEQTPLKAGILFANSFLYHLQKKPRNKFLLAIDAGYFLSNTFSS